MQVQAGPVRVHLDILSLQKAIAREAVSNICHVIAAQYLKSLFIFRELDIIFVLHKWPSTCS